MYTSGTGACACFLWEKIKRNYIQNLEVAILVYKHQISSNFLDSNKTCQKEILILPQTTYFVLMSVSDLLVRHPSLLIELLLNT